MRLLKLPQNQSYPVYMTRQAWRAVSPQRSLQDSDKNEQSLNQITTIVFSVQTKRSIGQVQRDDMKGFTKADLSNHFYINEVGEIFEGRRLNWIGKVLEKDLDNKGKWFITFLAESPDGLSLERMRKSANKIITDLKRMNPNIQYLNEVCELNAGVKGRNSISLINSLRAIFGLKSSVNQLQNDDYAFVICIRKVTSVNGKDMNPEIDAIVYELEYGIESQGKTIEILTDSRKFYMFEQKSFQNLKTTAFGTEDKTSNALQDNKTYNLTWEKMPSKEWSTSENTIHILKTYSDHSDKTFIHQAAGIDWLGGCKGICFAADIVILDDWVSVKQDNRTVADKPLAKYSEEAIKTIFRDYNKAAAKYGNLKFLLKTESLPIRVFTPETQQPSIKYNPNYTPADESDIFRREGKTIIIEKK